jgi:hypothetical protein
MPFVRSSIRARQFLVFLVIFALLFGCGEKTYPSQPLVGNVTIDGEPLAEGNITFVPQDKEMGPEVTAVITAGKYKAQVPSGRLKVYLQGTRATGKMVEEYGVQRPELVNAIPSEYQAGIDLDSTILSAEYNFQLTSQPR